MMRFEKINDATRCNCLEGASQNTADLFVRKIRKSPALKDEDFRSYIERGKTPEAGPCLQTCGYYGVSFEIWNDSSTKGLLEKYRYTAAISPKSKNNLCVVRFKAHSGLLKHSPDQQIYNVHHYDLYKDDTFFAADLELIEMISLNAN